MRAFFWKEASAVRQLGGLQSSSSRQMVRQAGDRARKYGSCWKLGKLLARHVKMLEAATMEPPGRGLKGLKYALALALQLTNIIHAREGQRVGQQVRHGVSLEGSGPDLQTVQVQRARRLLH